MNKIGYWLLVIGCWSIALENGWVFAQQQITTNNKQQITNNKQQITNNKQQITNNKQQITNNKQQITNNKQLITVNSNSDRVQPDGEMTLREAIALVNGDLTRDDLSPREQDLLQTLPALSLFDRPRIVFNLSADRTAIELQSPLPEISRSLVIDGTTQSGYVRNTPIPQPIVQITPASGVEIMRGLTITSDLVTIRGLHLYGFNAASTATERTPIADIFISHPSPPSDTQLPQSHDWEFPLENRDRAPKDIVIENNWIGFSISRSPLPPLLRGVSVRRGDRSTTNNQQQITNNKSAFGIYVFNSNGTSIIRNRIAGMQGSGILTGIRANNLLIENNIIEDNGFAGMSDGIRLEGEINNTQILGNQIQNNAGSGIYAFKPEGRIAIEDNLISNNGRRFRRAAIFLMGSDRLVRNNQIRNQPGAGIVVAAFPKSDRVFITDNQFTNVRGLSIDLIAQTRSGVHEYHNGDGLNPMFKEHHRRRQVANYAIAAPRFASREFFRFPSGKVHLTGTAEPRSRVDLYRVLENPEVANLAGPLNVFVTSALANEEGEFHITLSNLRPGERISAIATHPDYGTSEPALNATIFQ